MKQILANSFSLQMLDTNSKSTVSIEPIPAPSTEELQKMESVIGHADTARILGVQANRVSIKLEKGTELIVAQVVGNRLPEGATTLPEGSKLVFLKVTLV